MAKINFNVTGITCGGCEKSIRNALLANKGVSDATASRDTGIVTVDYSAEMIQPDQLKQAIIDAGFEIAA
jgi:copper chaperone